MAFCGSASAGLLFTVFLCLFSLLSYPTSFDNPTSHTLCLSCLQTEERTTKEKEEMACHENESCFLYPRKTKHKRMWMHVEATAAVLVLHNAIFLPSPTPVRNNEVFCFTTRTFSPEQASHPSYLPTLPTNYVTLCPLSFSPCSPGENLQFPVVFLAEPSLLEISFPYNPLFCSFLPCVDLANRLLFISFIHKWFT